MSRENECSRLLYSIAAFSKDIDISVAQANSKLGVIILDRCRLYRGCKYAMQWGSFCGGLGVEGGCFRALRYCWRPRLSNFVKKRIITQQRWIMVEKKNICKKWSARPVCPRFLWAQFNSYLWLDLMEHTILEVTSWKCFWCF